MAWVKGQSGNPKGRPEKTESLTELMRVFLANKPKESKKTYRELLIQKAYQMAMKGDITALKMIWNYLDGMPIQKTKNENLNYEVELTESEKKEIKQALKHAILKED